MLNIFNSKSADESKKKEQSNNSQSKEKSSDQIDILDELFSTSSVQGGSQNKKKKIKKMSRAYRSVKGTKQNKEWLSLVSSRMQHHMTPELQEEFKRKAQRQRHVHKRKKKVQNYQRANMLSKSAWCQGNARMAYQSAPVRSINRSSIVQRQEVEKAAVTSRNQMMAINNVYTTNLEDSDEEEDMLDNILNNVESVQVTEASVNKSVAIDDKTEANILLSLRVEPKDETIVKQKYGLFEDFLKNVEASRKATFDFWKESKKDFAEIPTASKQVERDLKNIDSEDNLGINFDERNWFVYSMMVQADKNNEQIKNLLKTIDTKYDLLKKMDDDCPFCLDPLQECKDDPDNDVVTLQCCHKACKDCWTNWQNLKGHNAFCPLCKHKAFLGEVYQYAQNL